MALSQAIEINYKFKNYFQNKSIVGLGSLGKFLFWVNISEIWIYFYLGNFSLFLGNFN